MIVTGKTKGGLQSILARVKCWWIGHKLWKDAPITAEIVLGAARSGKYAVPCTRCGEQVEVLVDWGKKE